MSGVFLIISTILAVLIPSHAAAQQASQLESTNQSVVITFAHVFQEITITHQAMRSLTIQNNNPAPTANCWIEISGLVTKGETLSTLVHPKDRFPMPAEKASILLGPGQSYGRFFPHLPLGPIVGTCAKAGDSIYVDWQ
jgi:type II secretory pathway pseudopilin PulG